MLLTLISPRLSDHSSRFLAPAPTTVQAVVVTDSEPDDTQPEDIYEGATSDEERLAIERKLITQTDNSARPEDGEQPVIEDDVEVGQ